MSDLAAWKVRGPVRTLRSEHAEWDQDRNAWKAARGVAITTFRADGQFSESEHHNPHGSIARSAHRYDDDGRLVETHRWTNDEPRTRVRYAYDATGRRTEATEILADGTTREVEAHRYDEAGRKITLRALAAPRAGIQMMHGVEGSEQSYAAPGATASRTVYDDRDLPVEVTFQDPEGGVVLRIELSRDGEGRMVAETARSGVETPWPGLSPDSFPPVERAQFAAILSAAFADQTFATATYAYDAHGRLVAQTRKIGSLSEEQTVFEYGDSDDPIAEISKGQHREIGMDADGNVQYKEADPLLEHRRFDYRYDSHGNWTERVGWFRISSHSDFQRTNVERRTITYYE